MCTLGQLATLHTEHDCMHKICGYAENAFLLGAEVPFQLRLDCIFQLQSSALTLKSYGQVNSCRNTTGTAPQAAPVPAQSTGQYVSRTITPELYCVCLCRKLCWTGTPNAVSQASWMLVASAMAAARLWTSRMCKPTACCYSLHALS